MRKAWSLFARGFCRDVEVEGREAAAASLFLGVAEVLGGGIIIMSPAVIVVVVVTVVGGGDVVFLVVAISSPSPPFFSLLAAAAAANNDPPPPSPPLNLSGALVFRLFSKFFFSPANCRGGVSPGGGWRLGWWASPSWLGLTPSPSWFGWAAAAAASWPPCCSSRGGDDCPLSKTSSFTAAVILDCRRRKRFSRS